MKLMESLYPLNPNHFTLKVHKEAREDNMAILILINLLVMSQLKGTTTQMLSNTLTINMVVANMEVANMVQANILEINTVVEMQIIYTILGIIDLIRGQDKTLLLNTQ